MGKSQTSPRARPTLPAVVARVLLVAVGVVVTGFTASVVVPGLRAEPGFVPLYDGWLQCGGYLLCAAVATLRVVTGTPYRLLWSLVAAALALRVLGFLWLILVVRRDAVPDYPSGADGGWLVSGVLFVAALGVLARICGPRNSRTLVLDGLLGALTAAGVAVSFLYAPLVRLTAPGTPADAIATNLAYPVIDVAMLMIVLGLLAASGWRLPPAAAALSAGLTTMAVVDSVFLLQLAAGTFRPGTLLQPLSLAGTAVVALACWLPLRDRRGRPEERPAGLVTPVALALVCVATLIYDALRPGEPLGVVLTAGGLVVAILRGLVTLTTDRREARSAMGATEQERDWFRALVEASGDFIGIADREGRLVYLNPGGRRLVGLTDASDVTATAVSDYLTPRGLREWQRARHPAVLSAGHWEGESELRDHRGGAPIPVAASTFAIGDPETGAPWLIGTVQRDISDRKAAEEELRRFSSLVEASNDFIAIAGIDGQVHYLNPGGRTMVGVPPEADVTATTIADYLTEEGLRASIEIEQPAVVADGYWEGESTLRDQRGGPPTPVAINSFLMRHPDTGEPWLLATVQRDISERLASQREVQALADQRQLLLGHLVQAQEDERARIAADVHDDSVQALAAVELRLSLLRREIGQSQPDLLPSVESLRGTVRGATERLRHLLFDLESPARDGDLPTALESAAAFVFEDAVRWRIDHDGVAPDQASRVTAYRIAKEAMVNVRKHAEANEVVVSVCRRGGGVEIAVTDDGRGFDPTTLGERPGHLGLPGMRDRAAVAGGRLEVESVPGQGSTVRLWLPGQSASASTDEGSGQPS